LKIYKITGLPWRFSFELKFYPEPSKLTEDLTRYLVSQQLRRDVYSGRLVSLAMCSNCLCTISMRSRLPTSLPVQAKLGSLAAQADFGDYKGPTEEYRAYLRDAKLAQLMPDSLQEKIAEFHVQHK